MTQEHDGTMESLLQEVFSSKEGVKEVLEFLVNQGMEAELATHLQAARHERSAERKGYRNGRKPRKLKTRVGELNLSVPQSRNCEPYHPSMFSHWQRSERALLVACAEMYFQGVSTRKVQAVLEEMCGLGVSSATVSRVAAELDEKLSAFRKRRLDVCGYPYLLVDARYEKVRVDGHVVSQAVLTCAGINDFGFREILDWRIGDSESEDTWSEVFRHLKDRGLKGVQMITSDAHGGIRAAIKRHFQGISWQRCRVHFMRELMGKVSYKKHKEIAADIKSVFHPEERKECLRRAEEMAVKWEGRYPKVAAMLREGLEDCLTVCDLPSEHRRKLHSTNMLERIMRELKRRTAVVGVFPNRSSCDRLIGAHLVEMDENWQVEGKRYMNMDRLEKRTTPAIPVKASKAG